MKNQKKTFFAWVKVFLVVAVFLTAGIVGGTKAEAKHTHSYTWKVIKAATCTADGYRNEVCSCGHVRNSQTIPKTPHSYAAATCTKPATCSCGATKGSKLGHSFTIAATCTSPAKCSRSGCTATSGSPKVLLTAPFVQNQSMSVVRKLSVCMPTPFPKSA